MRAVVIALFSVVLFVSPMIALGGQNHHSDTAKQAIKCEHSIQKSDYYKKDKKSSDDKTAASVAEDV